MNWMNWSNGVNFPLRAVNDIAGSRPSSVTLSTSGGVQEFREANVYKFYYSFIEIVGIPKPFE